MNCGVGHRRSSDPAMLWLWWRLAAAAPFWPLAWELPHAAGVTLKRKKKKKRCDKWMAGQEGKSEPKEWGSRTCHNSQLITGQGPGLSLALELTPRGGGDRWACRSHREGSWWEVSGSQERKDRGWGGGSRELVRTPVPHFQCETESTQGSIWGDGRTQGVEL